MHRVPLAVVSTEAYCCFWGMFAHSLPLSSPLQARVSCTREALRTWHDAAAALAAERRLLHHALMHMTHSRLAAALAGWRTAARDRRQKRQLMQVRRRILYTLPQCCRPHASTRLSSWRLLPGLQRQWHAHPCHLLLATQLVAARLRDRHALRALNRWREYAGERAVLREKARRVVERMLACRLHAALR
jgi:hypothetical protein